MLIRFCLCFGMGCTPSMLSENNRRRNRKNSDIYTQSNNTSNNTNNGKSSEIIQDSTKCNQILVNPYQGFKNKKEIVITPESGGTTTKKDSIISVTATGHIIGHIIPPTVRRATIASKYLLFIFKHVPTL